MKKTILSILLFVVGLIHAQDNKSELIKNTLGIEEKSVTDTVDGWKKGGVISINFSNVGLSNWAAGGSNSMSFTALTGLYANYRKRSSTWDNNLDLGLGMIHQFASNVKSSDVPWIKSDDKIDFTSKYGYKASDKWYYSGLMNFKSQFLDGYNDPYAPDTSKVTISNFLAPAYAVIAIGMDFKPNKNLSIFIAPATAKFTIVNDSELNSIGAFGVDSNQIVRTEMGFYLRVLYNKDIVENVNFSTKVEIFQNYETIGHIDVAWETLTTMKVNKYISATFATSLIYDDDIDIAVDENNNGVIEDFGILNETKVRTQFKHVLGIGLTYKF